MPFGAKATANEVFVAKATASRRRALTAGETAGRDRAAGLQVDLGAEDGVRCLEGGSAAEARRDHCRDAVLDGFVEDVKQVRRDVAPPSLRGRGRRAWFPRLLVVS
jgi:hypothetical protein